MLCCAKVIFTLFANSLQHGAMLFKLFCVVHPLKDVLTNLRIVFTQKVNRGEKRYENQPAKRL